MNNQTALDLLIAVRQQLVDARYDEGELSGVLPCNTNHIAQLSQLAAAGLADDGVLLHDQYVLLNKLPAACGSLLLPVVLYTKKLRQCRYYETVEEFIKEHPYQYPSFLFYIQELHFLSSNTILPQAIARYKDVLKFLDLLLGIADYINELPGEAKEVMLFSKRKLTIVLQYQPQHLRSIPFLEQLLVQLHEAHDKEERKTIFTAELVNLLYPFAAAERLGALLSLLDTLYDNYLKSHLLYLEKFSYHDLKLKVDKDKLEYTKKIYATVNDIQSRMIAVPAAYLFVLAQFDFAAAWSVKNGLILLGALLFTVLLEVLLRNQFGVLQYVEKEVLHFKAELSNTTTSVDLSLVTQSFGSLHLIAKKQRLYLWIFRAIVWSVPVMALLLFFLEK